MKTYSFQEIYEAWLNYGQNSEITGMVLGIESPEVLRAVSNVLNGYTSGCIPSWMKNQLRAQPAATSDKQRNKYGIAHEIPIERDEKKVGKSLLGILESMDLGLASTGYNTTVKILESLPEIQKFLRLKTAIFRPVSIRDLFILKKDEKKIRKMVNDFAVSLAAKKMAKVNERKAAAAAKNAVSIQKKKAAEEKRLKKKEELSEAKKRIEEEGRLRKIHIPDELLAEIAAGRSFSSVAAELGVSIQAVSRAYKYREQNIL